MHPLFFAVDLQCHTCDVCQERTKAPHYEAWRCRTCDFDLCSRCYRRRNNPDFKGVAFRNTAANDPNDPTSTGGENVSESLSTYGYFKKCVQLCLEFWQTLLLATGSLICCQICVLIAPNLQGRIFDAIIGKVVTVDAENGSMTLTTNGLRQFLDPTKIFWLPISEVQDENLQSLHGGETTLNSNANNLQPDEERFY